MFSVGFTAWSETCSGIQSGDTSSPPPAPLGLHLHRQGGQGGQGGAGQGGEGVVRGGGVGRGHHIALPGLQANW